MQQSKTTKGSITEAGKDISLPVDGQSSAGIQVTGTYSGTLQFEGTIDGLNWVSLLLKVPSTNIECSSTSSTGVFIGPVAGIKIVRVRASALASGTASVTVVSSMAGNGDLSAKLTPNKAALARTVDATISTSTEITLNAATTFLRIYAIDKDVYLKWGTADVTASNFDEIIPANQIVDLYVPIESGTTLYTAINLIERAATGGIIVIEK